MTTHEFAKSLTKLASFLRSMPDMDLAEFFRAARLSRQVDVYPTVRKEREPNAVAVNVATLAALSKVNKAQWQELIDVWGLPITLNRKDSSRNIMGEVMRYLADHPSEILRLQRGTGRSSKASPALMKALSILMGASNHEEPGP